MPSRREQIAMNADELRAYLMGQQRIILITNGPGGFPHPMPMNYGLDERGRVLMLTFAKGQKVRNLERDPRASLLVESGTVYHELKSAILYCRTEIIPPGPEFDMCRKAFAAKNHTQTANNPGNQAAIDASMAKRVALRFTPERLISWDHQKLAGAY